MSILDKIPLSDLRSRALDFKPEIKSLFSKLNKNRPKNLDKVVHTLHEEIFQQINCLDCANCCKSISPTLYDKDIERLAKHLRIKPSQFVDKYLYIDKDGDYVYQDTPCPFLLPDNYCLVYDARPKACREYPHTNRKKFYQILKLTLKNTEVCPAVFELVKRIKNLKEFQ